MPPKANRSRSSDSPFLFVHENATTVTRVGKDAELDREKQSHVQRQNFARRRQLREQQGLRSGNQDARLDRALVPSSSTSPVPQASPYSIPTAEVENFFPFPDSQLFGTPEFTGATTSDFDNAFFPTAEFDTGYVNHGFDFPQLHSPNTLSGDLMTIQSHVQPSVVVSVAQPALTHITPLYIPQSSVIGTKNILEKWAPPLIQHYNTVILPEKFYADVMAVPLHQIRHASAIHEDMQVIMAEPSHLYSFLASASAQMLAREGRLYLPDLPEHDHYRVPLFFKTKAMTSLRSRLARGTIDRNVVKDVFRLMAVPLHMDNYEAAEPHLQALQTMISLVGGLDTFDVYFVEKNMLLDCGIALQRLTKPRFPILWDPGQGFSGRVQGFSEQGLRIDALGTRLAPIKLAGFLTSSETECFDQMIEVARMEQWVREQPIYHPKYYQWLSFRRMAIAYSLFDSGPLDSCHKECFRISTLFYIALTRSPSSGQRRASKQIITLKHRLQLSELMEKWNPHKDLLLWVTMNGGLVARKTTENAWFLDLFRKIAEEMNITSISEVEEIMSGFLYDPLLLHEPLLEFLGSTFSI